MADSKGLKGQPGWLADFLRDDWTVAMSTLFCPPVLRQAFGALFMIRAAMLRFWEETHTPMIAEVKLGYWLQELQQMCAGGGSHPAILALQPHLADHPDLAGRFFDLAEVTLHGLQGGADVQQLAAGAAAPVVAAGMLLGAASPEAQDAAKRLGMRLTATERIERTAAAKTPADQPDPRQAAWQAMLQKTSAMPPAVQGGALGALDALVTQRSQAILAGQPFTIAPQSNAKRWLVTLKAWREAGRAERRLQRFSRR